MAFWYDETFEDRTRYGCKVSEVLFSERSAYQKVEVFDTVHYGRTLVLDGIFMTSEREEHFYHEMLVQPAMALVHEPGRVLIIGGGDGGTAREVLRHLVPHTVTLVEIDETVLRACREHLPTIGTCWDDPRLELIVGNGVSYVEHANAAYYDLVIIDGCDPVGPARGLFSVEFYRACERLLRPGGALALQAGSPILQHDQFIETIANLRQVFPRERVKPYFGPAPLYASDLWSWALASHELDWHAIIEDRAARVEPHTKYYNREIHRAAFALPNNLKRELGA